MDKLTRNIMLITYISVAGLFWYLFSASFNYIAVYFHLLDRYSFVAPVVQIGPILLGVLASFALYKVKRLKEYFIDVITEVKKVTWPPKKETWGATVVVIIAVLISALMLGVFDWISSTIIKYILA
jgi:preprotein translocase subunit SecE